MNPKTPLTVFKISGKLLDDKNLLGKTLHSYRNYPFGQKILVHGGGIEIDHMMNELKLPIEKIQGKRITDMAAIQTMILVCAGLNEKIKESLNSPGRPSRERLGQLDPFIGLPQTFINSTRRPVKPEADYGFVGDVSEKTVNADGIKEMLECGKKPIFSPITWDASRQEFLNSNADGVATAIAVAMSKYYKVSLVFLSDVRGVLDADKKLIPEINENKYAELKAAGIVTDGMIPKLDSAFKAIDKGVTDVRIANEIYDDIGRTYYVGTKIIGKSK